jgi:GTP-binding protein
VAIDSADVILFVVDTRDGITALDQEVDQRLRHVDVPVVCVANKADTDTLGRQADDFYRFGRKVLPVSARENRGKDDLLAALAERLPPPDAAEVADETTMKVAIVGRRNTGKSTFVNTLAEAERMIVSEVPGTTRDSVDVHFDLDGKTFVAIDTPGFMRTKSFAGDLDFYSMHRAQRSIRRADVVLLFFDATLRIAKLDKQLCDYVAQQYKPCVFVVNKWDLLKDTMPTEKWVHYLRDTFRTMWYVPIAFITGQSGKNVKALLNHAQMLHKQSLQRSSTAQLNKVVQIALEKNPPPLYRSHRPRIYYATQVGIQPPTVVLFANNPKALTQQYQRYLLSVFRDNLEFPEVPIKLYLRKRASSDKTDAIEAKPAE